MTKKAGHFWVVVLGVIDATTEFLCFLSVVLSSSVFQYLLLKFPSRNKGKNKGKTFFDWTSISPSWIFIYAFRSISFNYRFAKVNWPITCVQGHPL